MLSRENLEYVHSRENLEDVYHENLESVDNQNRLNSSTISLLMDDQYVHSGFSIAIFFLLFDGFLIFSFNSFVIL